MVNIALSILAGFYLLSATAAQDLDRKIPECATTCIDTEARKIGCEVSNPTCSCNNSSFLLSVQGCMSDSCNDGTDELQKGLRALGEVCANVSTTASNSSRTTTLETTTAANSTHIFTSTLNPNSSFSQSSSRTSSTTLSSTVLPASPTASEASSSTVATNTAPGRTLPPATGIAGPATTVVSSTTTGSAQSTNVSNNIISAAQGVLWKGILIALGFSVL